MNSLRRGQMDEPLVCSLLCTGDETDFFAISSANRPASAAQSAVGLLANGYLPIFMVNNHFLFSENCDIAC